MHQLVDRWQRAHSSTSTAHEVQASRQRRQGKEDQRIVESKKLLARAAYAASVPVPKTQSRVKPGQTEEQRGDSQSPPVLRRKNYVEVQQTPVQGPIMFESVQRSCTAVTRHLEEEVPASCPAPATAPAPAQPSPAAREAAARRSAAWRASGACDALAAAHGAAGGDSSGAEGGGGGVEASAPVPADWLHAIVQDALQAESCH